MHPNRRALAHGALALAIASALANPADAQTDDLAAIWSGKTVTFV